MSDKYGLKAARERGIKLGDVGHRIVEENDLTRVWELRLEPAESIDYHIHYHPYLVISLQGGENEVESILGDRFATYEEAGHTVYIDHMRPVHKLTNKADITYVSRLIEFKSVTWSGEETAASAGPELPGNLADAFREVLINSQDLEWAPKSLDGLYHKMLWREESTGASIALIRFDKGVGIPEAHAHASNQFMYCLSGRYRYIPTGTTLTPGAFYWNPKGSVHGPTIADEDTIFLEIYDGPHYPVKPSWYTDEEDAR